MSVDNMVDNPYYEQIDTRSRGMTDYYENESHIPEEYNSNLRMSQLRADVSDDLPFGNKYGLSRSVFISPKANNVDTLKENKENMLNYADFVLLFDLCRSRDLYNIKMCLPLMLKFLL